MLGKLLKYELQASARSFLPIYALILVVSAINSLFISFDFIEGTMGATMVLVALGIALGVVTLLVLVKRFYQNLLGDEGYLMNTLPVSADSLIWSKLITVAIWSISSVLVAIIAAMILLLNQHSRGDFFMAVENIFAGFSTLIQNLTPHAAFTVLLILLVLIVNAIAGVFQCYFSIAITQLSPFHKHRIPAAIVCYVLINVLHSILGTLQLFDNKLDFSFTDLLANQGSASHGLDAAKLLQLLDIQLLIFLLISALMAAILYLGTRYILKNKLNLE